MKKEADLQRESSTRLSHCRSNLQNMGVLTLLNIYNFSLSCGVDSKLIKNASTGTQYMTVAAKNS